MRAIFLDRDGTLNLEPTDEIVASADQVILHTNVIEGLQILAGLDYKIFILTNQIGIAQKRITEEQFQAVNQKVLELIAPSGVQIIKTYFCPHQPADNCDCRKPKTGMIKQLLAENLDIDVSNSWVIGDRLSDVGLAQAIGSRMILVNMAGKYIEDTAEFVAHDLLDAAQIIQNEG
ncbi:HAD-IIIA family hydrolase [Candidatus Saccharibacteria bacterium]|nr:HAD-IIIA family hydrolase [Candidatus Saccharibacteria bacterium]